MNWLYDIQKIYLLLSHGANVKAQNTDGRSAIMLASMKGNSEIVRVLAYHGAELDAIDLSGWCALHYACHFGHSEVVQTLLELGCDDGLSGQSSVDPTPFHIACASGYLPILYYFLRERTALQELRQ